MSIGNIVSRNAMRFPDREALVYEDIRTTWTQLNERVNRLADAFLSMGLQKGDKVAMLSENVPAIVLKPGEKATGNELLAFAREKLPGYKRPKVVYLVKELPRNPSGKVLKYKLREGHDEQL